MKLRIAALLLLVAAAGYVATNGLRVDPLPFGVLMVSGLLASGGASATNHYVDRDLDGKMRRTRARPLPQRRIAPAWKALAFGLALTTTALVLAALLINVLTAATIALGFAFYVGVYTMGLKRTHSSNIVIGGFAGSCPALAGSAAASGGLSVPALLIALLVFLWTPGHFWALAYRTRDDYREAGIPMLPAVRDERTTVRAIAASVATLPAATLAFAFAPSFSTPAYVGVAVAAGAVLVVLTARFVRNPTPETALAGYRYSGVYLALILAAMMVSAIVAA
jgi:protoheme IX farnesyltransferase